MGLAAYVASDYGIACKLLTHAADLGYAATQAFLGMQYEVDSQKRLNCCKRA